MEPVKEEPVINRDEEKILSFMIRPCEIYKAEYKDCKSVKARLHQHFINGEITDCESWKRDYESCLKWEKDEDGRNAFKQLIASERERHRKRLQPHFSNDIWKKRKEPPEDWNKPLPAWFEENNKNSFLAIKAEELRNPAPANQPNGERTLCTIL